MKISEIEFDGCYISDNNIVVRCMHTLTLISKNNYMYMINSSFRSFDEYKRFSVTCDFAEIASMYLNIKSPKEPLELSRVKVVDGYICTFDEMRKFGGIYVSADQLQPSSIFVSCDWIWQVSTWGMFEPGIGWQTGKFRQVSHHVDFLTVCSFMAGTYQVGRIKR